MKLSALRYLVAFADEGSFSRAAERCHVSQPTLSVALQNLEAELEVVLIERSKSHVALTDIGHQVAAQARRALDEARRIELIAHMDKDPLRGEFRLGIIHTIGPYLLPGLITSLRRLAPELTLYIEESMTALLADFLKYGTVDAAIIALPFDVPGVETRALYDEADISHAEGSLHQGHSIETIRCMVASGYGISVLPEGALSGPYRSEMVASIPFREPAPSRRVALAWRRGFPRPKVIETIVAAVAAMNNPAYRTL